VNLQKKYITYNSLLKIINIALYIVTIFFYTFNEMTILVNNYTLIIYSLLFLQIQLFLNHEKKYNNPFIILLSFILIVYTYPRVLTFYWYNDNLPNLTLNRIIPTTVFDVNYSLFFIFISNFFIYFGLIYGKIQANKAVPNKSYFYLNNSTIKKVRNIFTLFLILQLFLYTITSFFKSNQFISLILFFTDTTRILPFFIFYILCLIKYQDIKKNKLIFLQFVFLLLSWIFFNYISGNRSGFINILQTVGIISIVVGFNSIKKMYILIILSIGLLSIPLYIVGTLSRDLKLSDTRNIGIAQVYTLVSEQLPELLKDNDNITIINPIINRASYLDYSIDLIKNSDKYHSVVNVQYYLMSIIDGLTPGFDVFNVPKSSNSLIGIYGNSGLLKRNDTFYDYQSDQFNVYGEFYVAFYKWFSLIPLFIFSFIFSFFYYKLSNNESISLIWKCFILFQFFNWLRSFGTDWLFIYLIIEYLSYKIFIILFEKKIVLH
jgi:hypothetical protein